MEGSDRIKNLPLYSMAYVRQTKDKVMMTKNGLPKCKFYNPGAGFLVLRRGQVSYCENALFLLKILFSTPKQFCFVCLEFIVPLENFHSYREVTITSEGLQMLTYPRHSWPLSSEGFLVCHTYCDTGPPFIMVISKDP